MAPRWIILAAALAAMGCSSPRALDKRFRDDDPAVRRGAIVQAGQTRDASAVPHLVASLEDEEQDVRFFAILALERVTGTTMGYKYYTPPRQQPQALERWHRWLAEHPVPPLKSTRVAEGDANEPRRDRPPDANDRIGQPVPLTSASSVEPRRGTPGR